MASSARAALLPNEQPSPPEPKKPINPNVKIMWLFVATLGVSESIWAQTVLVNFLSDILGANRWVGYIEAAQGAANVLFALPIGIAADRGRSRVIRIGACLTPLAAGLTAYGVLAGGAHYVPGVPVVQIDTRLFGLFVASMALWGITSAIAHGPAEALYADSMATGDRSRGYTILFSIYLAASIAGPLTTIIMFATDGDRWDVGVMQKIVLCGLALEIPAALLMFGLRDSAALNEEADPVPAAAMGGDADAADAALAVSASAHNAAATNQGDKVPLSEPAVPPRHDHSWAVPYLLFGSSLLFALGSGMSVKFFPLFFRNLGMSPVQVQIIYVIVPLVMAALSSVGTRLSRRLGRVQVMLLLKLVGISLLVSMGLLSRGAPAPRAPLLVLLVTIYVMRTGLMNCSYPLEESVLMDNVPKNRRARWKSVESISMFGWCGSAALGGILYDRYKSYPVLFFVTAGFQLAGTLALIPLLVLVPRSEQAQSAAVQGARAAAESPLAISSTAEGVDGRVVVVEGSIQ